MSIVTAKHESKNGSRSSNTDSGVKSRSESPMTCGRLQNMGFLQCAFHEFQKRSFWSAESIRYWFRSTTIRYYGINITTKTSSEPMDLIRSGKCGITVGFPDRILGAQPWGFHMFPTIWADPLTSLGPPRPWISSRAVSTTMDFVPECKFLHHRGLVFERRYSSSGVFRDCAEYLKPNPRPESHFLCCNIPYGQSPVGRRFVSTRGLYSRASALRPALHCRSCNVHDSLLLRVLLCGGCKKCVLLCSVVVEVVNCGIKSQVRSRSKACFYCIR